MSNEPRRTLLREYAVALVAERAAWERLHEPQLGDADRHRALAAWRHTAASVKVLGARLRVAEPAVVDRCPATAQEDQPAGGRPEVPALAAALRLLVLWGSRLQAGVPRPGSS